MVNKILWVTVLISIHINIYGNEIIYNKDGILISNQDLVELKIGDSIVTSGFSSTFPENIPIGKIKSYSLNETKDLYIINVELFNDMTNLRHVHVVRNNDYMQIENLINE